jgi:hypothetical protein
MSGCSYRWGEGCSYIGLDRVKDVGRNSGVAAVRNPLSIDGRAAGCVGLWAPGCMLVGRNRMTTQCAGVPLGAPYHRCWVRWWIVIPNHAVASAIRVDQNGGKCRCDFGCYGQTNAPFFLLSTPSPKPLLFDANRPRVPPRSERDTTSLTPPAADAARCRTTSKRRLALPADTPTRR